MILDLQGNMASRDSSCLDKGSACSRIMSTSRYIFDTEVIIEVLFMLMLIGDSALAYKTTLVTAMGIYILSFI